MFESLKIDKPIRLIELFAGIGSQAKALKKLGADFEHYRICEFDKYAIKSYNAIHGTDFPTSDVTQITAADLGIVDTDKYCYLLTYSFPCQDLSVAGKGKGMAKGDNTRSGLLWEVERLLNECDELPQILLMENVTQVHGKKNKEHFDEWLAFLESKGYSNYWKDLNAKNFGIPQNRNRTFMVSVLGDYTYEFPKEFPLELRLKDMLEDSVDEKFYISNEKLEKIAESLPQINDTQTGIVGSQATKFEKLTDISNTLMARDYKGFGNQEMNCVIEPKVKRLGNVYNEKFTGCSFGGNVWDKEGLAPALKTTSAASQQFVIDNPKIQKVCQLDGAHEQSGRVYSADGISPTIMSNSHGKTDGGYTSPKIAEGFDPFICASRGRNPENPSDRTAGIHTEQRLEPNFSGCTNTLTTVQKDNYVVEPQVLRAERTEYGKAIRKQYESGEINEKIGNMREMKPRHDGVSNTITTVLKDNYLAEPQINVVGNYSPSGHDASRIVDMNGLAPTVKENHGTVTAIAEPIINKIDVPQTVRVRKYEVDCTKLCETLRAYKHSSGLKNQDIAEQLNIPITKVEHWFRQDKSFAIPDENIWFELKGLLGIETDEFDAAIMTFEEKEGVFEKSNRCYFSNGLAPTITSASADGKIIEPLAYDEQNSYIRKDGIVGTLTTDGSSPKHNNRVIEPLVWDGYNQRIRKERGTVGFLTTNCGADLKRNGQGIIEPVVCEQRRDEGLRFFKGDYCGTLRTIDACGDKRVIEPTPVLVGGIGEKNFGTQYRQGNRVYDSEAIAMALGASPVGNAGGNSYLYQVQSIRIRKLTPKECWRLMGFDDADYEKAAAVNSNTQLYKQAGNSIVVDVLYYIFRNMLEG